MRNTTRLILLFGVGACGPQLSQHLEKSSASQSSALSSLPIPAAAANGLNVELICRRSTTSGNCDLNDTAIGGNNTDGLQHAIQASNLVSTAAIDDFAAPLQNPFFFSWPNPHVIDWFGAGNGAGFFNTDQQTLTTALANAGNPPHQMPIVYSGYLKIPAGASNCGAGATAGICKTFAVGSDDGFFLSIGGYSQAATPTGAIGAHTTTFSTVRSFAYGDNNNGTSAGDFPTTDPNNDANGGNPLIVKFPTAGGLFPITLLFWENFGDYGVELAWVDGISASIPTGTGTLNGYSIVPAANLYAADVRATLASTISGAATYTSPGAVITYTASINNVGPVLAQGSAAQPLQFITEFPKTIFASASGAGCASGSNPANTSFRVTCPVNGSSAGQLQAGGADTATLTLTATLKAAITTSSVLADVQGVVVGTAGDPDIVKSVAVSTFSLASDFFVYSNTTTTSPAETPNYATIDSGNVPSGFTPTTSEAPNTQLTDDDPTRAVFAFAPTFLSPTSPTLDETNTRESFNGNCTGFGASTTIAVSISTVASCPLGWTGSAGTCTCTVAPTIAGASCTWSCPATLSLPDATYAASVVAIDAAGNKGKATPLSLTISPPSAPTITTPLDGATLFSTSVVIGGTAVDPGGSQILVTVKNKPSGTVAGTCTATVTGSGTWACQVTGLAFGNYTDTAAVVEGSGGFGAVSLTNDFSTSAGGLVAPVITQTPTPNNDALVSINGTCVNGNIISVYYDGSSSAACTPTCAAGAFTCAAPGTWSNGAHDAVATAFDGTNTSAFSNVDNFVIDTLKPPPPSINNVPLFINASGTNPPVVGGGGETGDTVSAEICDFPGCGSPIPCTSTTVVGGVWQCSIASPLPEGTYFISATQTDLAHNQSDPASGNTFTVDTTPPGAVTLIGATQPPTTPLQVTAITTQLTLQGTFDGDASETMVVTDATHRTICSTALSGQQQILFTGTTWKCTPDTTVLPDGSNTLTATATDLAGNTTSSAPLTFNKDTVKPTPPSLAPVTQFNSASATEPVYTGSAEPLTTITIYNTAGNVILCTTTALADGSFACHQNTEGSPTDLAAGPYTIDATSTDAAGNVSAPSAPVSFTIDPSKPSAPAISHVDQKAPSGSPLAVNTPNHTSHYDGTGIAGDTITLSAVGQGSPLCTTAVQGDGTWSCNATTLPNGSYTVSALQTRSGTPPVASPSSTAIKVTISDVTPAAPAISSITPSSPVSVGNPTLAGSGVVGDTVSVYDQNNTLMCTTTVLPTGTWSCQITVLNGNYDVRATQMSGAGVTSPDSAPFAFTVQTQNAPAITSPPSPTDQKRPIIVGTISAPSAGETVTVYGSTGNVVCIAAVANDGSWQCTPSQDFPEGLNTLQAQAADSDGHLSPLGPVYSLLTDYTPPPISLSGPSGITDTPTISGTSEPGATIVVTLDGQTPLCTAVTGANGQWSCIAGAPIGDGSHTVTAVATDAAGNASKAVVSAPFSISPGGSSTGGSSSGVISRLAGGGISACNATHAPLDRDAIGDAFAFALVALALKRRSRRR